MIQGSRLLLACHSANFSVYLQKPLQMGKERVKKAHLLLNVNVEMTHTGSIHFPLVSTSHTVPRLCKGNSGIESPAGWALPSITCMLWKGT